jgi:hypothetical protein
VRELKARDGALGPFFLQPKARGLLSPALASSVAAAAAAAVAGAGADAAVRELVASLLLPEVQRQRVQEQSEFGALAGCTAGDVLCGVRCVRCDSVVSRALIGSCVSRA